MTSTVVKVASCFVIRLRVSPSVSVGGFADRRRAVGIRVCELALQAEEWKLDFAPGTVFDLPLTTELKFESRPLCPSSPSPSHFGARRQPGRKFTLPQLRAAPIWLYNARSLAKAPLTQAAATRQASISGVS